MHSKRLKNACIARERNFRAIRNPRNTTLYHSYVMGSSIVEIPRSFQKYRSKEDYLSEDNKLVFVDLNWKNMRWLSEFANKVIEVGQDSRYTFYNNENDFKNPGMSCFRIFDDEDNCLHIQVRRSEKFPELFLLDYFENDELGNYDDKIVLVCNIANVKKTTVDIINTKLPSGMSIEYASRIGGIFRELMIYLRPWAYDKKAKKCEVSPFTELIFPNA